MEHDTLTEGLDIRLPLRFFSKSVTCQFLQKVLRHSLPCPRRIERKLID